MLKSKKLLFLIPVAALGLFSYTFTTQNEKEEAIDQILMQSLAGVHYSPMEINDAFSQKVFKLYIQRLDYSKKFLLESDVAELKKMESSIDEDIKDGKFTFFDKSLDMINSRTVEAQAYYKEIMEKPFDFSTEETLQLDAEKLPFAKTKDELKEAWRKSLKYQVLSRVSDLMDSQEKAREKSDTVKIKSMEEMEVDARKKVLKSNDDYFKRLKDLDRNDRLALYFNAVTGVYDPHTEYFAPKDKANFDIGMSGQLIGIGAQLQEKDGFIKVTNVIPGSPSWRQGQLKTGDIIQKVAQGAGEPVDLQDMQLDDAVQLIRGKKDTEVRLTVKKPDGGQVIIPLIRDVVVLEETFAQSAIIKGKKNIGYIKLPSFYADFNGNGGHSSAADVKKELQKLKDEKVDGVILDLRYNGGGSLSDVVDMTGLFIDKGPIVQVKSRIGSPEVKQDNASGVFYEGPLTVMVNSNSASASEILAAAIQDYKRGIIVGTSPSTFGKGTVQRFFNLDDYLPAQYASIKPLGEVKISTQKFYRINGDATQLKGVVPDIILPDPYYLLEQGEKEQDYPMVWDEIAPAKYQSWKPAYSIDKVKASSAARVKNSSGFGILEESAKRLKKQKDESIVSLNFDKYIAEQKLYKAEAKKMEMLDKEITTMDVSSLIADVIPVSDTVKVSKVKDWHKNIKKDIYLNETIAIMNEMK
ncbi:MAG: carboxy terminal-processing peptidase [Bacteroidota bacterium]|nr:carboxy terminal-processing peptidase [Bacteroidota bacterium]